MSLQALCIESQYILTFLSSFKFVRCSEWKQFKCNILKGTGIKGIVCFIAKPLRCGVQSHISQTTRTERLYERRKSGLQWHRIDSARRFGCESADQIANGNDSQISIAQKIGPFDSVDIAGEGAVELDRISSTRICRIAIESQRGIVQVELPLYETKKKL